MQALLCLLGLHRWLRAETHTPVTRPPGTLREEWRYCPHCWRGDVRSKRTSGLWDRSSTAWVHCEDAWEERQQAKREKV